MNTQLAELPPDWPAPEQLGFGRVLAPLALCSDHHADTGWSPLRVQPLAQAQAPVACGGLQYGLSVFEGLKAYRDGHGRAQLFRPLEHAARLRASAARLAMPAPDTALFLAACRLAVRVHEAFLPPPGRGSLYLRPTVLADEQGLGFRQARSHRLVLVVTPASDPALKTVNLWAEPELSRAAAGGVGAAKTGGNYAAGLLGLIRAREQGCDDVAWLDAHTHSQLAEAGTMNLFVQIDGRWHTPPLDGTILAGITRDSLMQLLHTAGQPVREHALNLAKLAELQRAGRLGAAIGCGTASRILRIASIRGPGTALRFEDEGGVEALNRRLKAVQENSAAERADWRVAVDAIG